MTDQQDTTTNVQDTGQEPTNTQVEQSTVQQPAPEQDTQQPAGQGDGQEPNPNHEAAKWRHKLRDQEKANAELLQQIEAVKNDKDGLVQQIGKAFGFIQDEGAEQADAAKILEQVTAERDNLNQELRNLRQENTLSKVLAGHPVDPSLTLAVLKGTGALDQLDPTSDDYASQVEQVVSETVEAHPQLRTQVVPKSSGQQPTPTDNAGSEITREDLARMTSAEINKAAAEGKLNHLMNQ